MVTDLSVGLCNICHTIYMVKSNFRKKVTV